MRKAHEAREKAIALEEVDCSLSDLSLGEEGDIDLKGVGDD